VPIQNIKLPIILDEIKELSTIPELQIKYYGMYDAKNEVDVKYREYLQSGKISKSKSDYFKNMPYQTMQELLSEPDDAEYQQKTVKIIKGKTEYKISRELINEASEELKETAEKVFNATTSITQEELDSKVHNREFVIEKLSRVLTNYLSTEQE